MCCANPGKLPRLVCLRAIAKYMYGYNTRLGEVAYSDPYRVVLEVPLVTLAGVLALFLKTDIEPSFLSAATLWNGNFVLQEN